MVTRERIESGAGGVSGVGMSHRSPAAFRRRGARADRFGATSTTGGESPLVTQAARVAALAHIVAPERVGCGVAPLGLAEDTVWA